MRNSKTGWKIIFFLIPFLCKTSYAMEVKKPYGFTSVSFGGGGFFYDLKNRKIGDLLSPEVRFFLTFFDPGIGFGINAGGYRLSLSSDHFKDYFPIFQPYLVFSKHIHSMLQFFTYGGGGFVRYKCVEKFCRDVSPVEGWGGVVETGMGLSIAHFFSIDAGVTWEFPQSPFEIQRKFFLKGTLGYYGSRYRRVPVPRLSIRKIEIFDENNDEKIVPGERGRIRIRVENTGDADAKNVSVEIKPSWRKLFDSYLILKRKEETIPVLEAGKSEVVDFEFESRNTEFVSGEYDIYIDVRYKEGKESGKITCVLSPPPPPPPLEGEERKEVYPEEFSATVGNSRFYDADEDGILETGERGRIEVEVLTDYPSPLTGRITIKEGLDRCIDTSVMKTAEVKKEEGKYLFSFNVALLSPCDTSTVKLEMVIHLCNEKGSCLSLSWIYELSAEERQRPVEVKKECEIIEKNRCWVYVAISTKHIENILSKKSILSTIENVLQRRENVRIIDHPLLQERIRACPENIPQDLSLDRDREGDLRLVSALGVRWFLEVHIEYSSSEGFFTTTEQVLVNARLYELKEGRRSVRSSSKPHTGTFTSSIFYQERPTPSNVAPLIEGAINEVLASIECD